MVSGCIRLHRCGSPHAPSAGIAPIAPHGLLALVNLRLLAGVTDWRTCNSPPPPCPDGACPADGSPPSPVRRRSVLPACRRTRFGSGRSGAGGCQARLRLCGPRAACLWRRGRGGGGGWSGPNKLAASAGAASSAAGEKAECVYWGVRGPGRRVVRGGLDRVRVAVDGPPLLLPSRDPPQLLAPTPAASAPACRIWPRLRDAAPARSAGTRRSALGLGCLFVS